MASNRGVIALGEAIDEALLWHSKEFHLSNAEGVGVLEFAKARLIAAAIEESEEED